MSASGPEPTEEEMRAAYEAELKKIRVEQILFEHVVTLINLGMRRTGLAPGTESERDIAQVRLAIEAIRAVVPLVEQVAPQQIGQIRQALSQLQFAYVQVGGQPAPAGESATPPPSGPPSPPPAAGPAPAAGPPPAAGPAATPEPPKPGEPGPAQRSGRLWIPGQ